MGNIKELKFLSRNSPSIEVMEEKKSFVNIQELLKYAFALSITK